MTRSGYHRIAVMLTTVGMVVATLVLSAGNAYAVDSHMITLVGDSITQGVATYEWPNILVSRLGRPAVPVASEYLLSGGRKGGKLVCGDWTVYDAGVNGCVTADMAGANWSLNVLRHRDSGFIVIMGGTNDIRFLVATPDIIANLTSMCARAEAAGAVPILCTILPLNIGTAEQKQQVRDLNAWIRSSGVSYVDFYAMAEDPVGSGVQSSGDGVHPSILTHSIMGNGFDLGLLGSVTPAVFNITSSHGLNGSISPVGTSGLDHGSDSATYTITPSAGSAIADVIVDGVSKGPIGTFKFTDLSGNHTITATFLQGAAVVYAPHAPSSALRRRTFAVYGYLNPRHEPGAQPIRLRFYRFNREKRTYVYYKTLRPAVYNSANAIFSKYSVKTTLPYAGKWRVRAYHGDGTHAAAYSGYDYLTVR